MGRKRRRSRPIGRSRRRLRPKPFVVLFLVVNCAVAVFASQITRVRTVQVSGAMAHDHDRIEAILAKLKDKPIFQINKQEISWELANAPEVRSVRFETAPFGTAWVDLQYRTPVVQFRGDEEVVMDFRGVIFRLPREEIPTGLPSLRLDRVYPPTLLTVAGDWPAADVGELATKLPSLPDLGAAAIEVDDRGAVCLNIPEGRILLGSTEDMDKKLDAYRRWKASGEADFSKILELNLMQPDHPTVRLRH